MSKYANILLKKPEEGNLSVWHIPQVSMRAFRVSVNTPRDGYHLMQYLACYDLFQLEQNIKPDFANAQGLDVFEDGEWVTWYDDDDDDIDAYQLNELDRLVKEW